MMVKLIGGKNIINQREKILAECELESLKEEEITGHGIKNSPIICEGIEVKTEVTLCGISYPKNKKTMVFRR